MVKWKRKILYLRVLIRKNNKCNKFKTKQKKVAWHNVPKHGSTSKQLDKEEFQEIGLIAAFQVLKTQFQMFIKLRIYLDDEYVIMTCNYFLQYTQLKIPEFCDTLTQHMKSVKKSIDERAQHKQEYDSRVNERQMQTIEEKVDMSKALDANLVDIESSRT
nr:hypothetical protein [Tanacetum cinerariifolium]